MPRSRLCREPASDWPRPRPRRCCLRVATPPTPACGSTRAAASAGETNASLRCGASDLAKVLLIARSIERNVAHLGHELRSVLIVELQEGLHFRPGQRLLADVHEER